MYIYFNKEGIITTQIPHGEVIRQGGTFTLSLCFEEDWDFSDKYILISFKRPSDTSFGTERYVSTTPRYEENFKKVKSSEMTYSFIEGKSYKFYDFHCDSLVGATQEFGNVQAFVKIVDRASLDTETRSVGNIYMRGLITFFVEKTYGYVKNTNISQSQFDYLMAYLGGGASGGAGKVPLEQTVNNKKITIIPDDNGNLNISVYNEEVDTGSSNFELKDNQATFSFEDRSTDSSYVPGKTTFSIGGFYCESDDKDGNSEQNFATAMKFSSSGLQQRKNGEKDTFFDVLDESMILTEEEIRTILK